MLFGDLVIQDTVALEINGISKYEALGNKKDRFWYKTLTFNISQQGEEVIKSDSVNSTLE